MATIALSVSLFMVLSVAGRTDRQQIVTLRKLPEKVVRSGQGNAVSIAVRFGYIEKL